MEVEPAPMSHPLVHTPVGALCCHDICGRAASIPCMAGKPPECLAAEVRCGERARPGDTFLVTFPKTGTTLLQFICHLLRCRCCEASLSFEDIHQVVPHTSSAWFIDQDLDAEQPGPPREGLGSPGEVLGEEEDREEVEDAERRRRMQGGFRLFKSHRPLEQVAPFARGVRFVAAIRHPTSTLVSLYAHRLARGRFPSSAPAPSIVEYAHSAAWTEAHMGSSMGNLWDYYLTFWMCRAASDFLVVPYELLVADKPRWLRIICRFLGIPWSDSFAGFVCEHTSKEWMLAHIDRFDESWVARRRAETGRAHPTISAEAPKVTLGHRELDEQVLSEGSVPRLHDRLWAERMASRTGCASYEAMSAEIDRLYGSMHLHEGGVGGGVNRL